MTPLYTAHASARGGREGVAASNDGKLEVRLSTPKELGGAGGEGTNPEQLFAAGYSACFLGALKFVASQNKIVIPADASVEAKVGIGKRDDGAVEAELVESVDQTTVPRSVKPAAGSGSNGRPSAPRSQARAFSPSDGRW